MLKGVSSLQRKRRGAVVSSKKLDSSISERLNLLSSPIPSDFNTKSLTLEAYENELKKLEDDYENKKIIDRLDLLRAPVNEEFFDLDSESELEQSYHELDSKLLKNENAKLSDFEKEEKKESILYFSPLKPLFATLLVSASVSLILLTLYLFSSSSANFITSSFYKTPFLESFNSAANHLTPIYIVFILLLLFALYLAIRRKIKHRFSLFFIIPNNYTIDSDLTPEKLKNNSIIDFLKQKPEKISEKKKIPFVFLLVFLLFAVGLGTFFVSDFKLTGFTVHENETISIKINDIDYIAPLDADSELITGNVVEKIKIKNLKSGSSIELREVDLAPPPHLSFLTSFAFKHDLDFDEAEFFSDATGSLYKCSLFDFDANECLGLWQYIKDVSGEFSESVWNTAFAIAVNNTNYTSNESSVNVSEQFNETFFNISIDMISNVSNLTETNFTFSNETAEENITNETEANVTQEETNFTINVTNFTLSNETNITAEVNITNETTNISIVNVTIVPVNVTNETSSNESNITTEVPLYTKANITELLEHYPIVVRKPVKWVKTITVNETISGLLTEIPSYAENITVLKNNITADIEINPVLENETQSNGNAITGNFFVRFFRFTGFFGFEPEENITIKINENITKNDTLEVIYETQGPELVEVEEENQKTVSVSSDISYQNVLAYTAVANIHPDFIRVYWVTNNNQILPFTYSDYDEDGNADEIQWIVPHLSLQTFLIVTNTTQEFTAHATSSTNITTQVSTTASNLTLVHGNDTEINTSLTSNLLLSLHFNNESWRNEGNSSFFNDSSGNNNHGSCSPLADDPRDKCPKIFFEDDLTNSGGIQGFIQFNTTQTNGRNITINPIGLGQNATVVLMFMPNATGALSLCILCNGPANTKKNTFNLLFSSSTLIMQVNDNNATMTTTTIQVSGAGGSPTDQKWRFIAFTSNYSNNGANVTLFVQDEGGATGIDQYALRSVDSANMINISNLDGDGKMQYYIGQTNASSPFNGFIDEVAIYNKTLSIPEIRALFERLRGKYPQNGTYTSKVFALNTTETLKNITFNGSQNYPRRFSQSDFPNDKVTIFGFNNESGENDTLFLSSTNSSLGGTCGLGIGNNASRCPAVTTGIEGKARYFNLTTFMRIEGQNTSNFDFSNDSSATIGVILRWEWQGSQGFGYIINMNRDEAGGANANRGRKSFGIQGTANNGAQPFYALGTTAPLCSGAQSGIILERNRWYFLALTFNSSNQNATVWQISPVPRERHRVTSCSNIISGGFNNTNGTTLIGTIAVTPSSSFNGTIDTLFIVNRTLSESELLKLYDGAFSTAKLQVRSCDDSACSGETFVGKDGTANTYFDNMSQLYTLNSTVTPANKFFQWKLFFESYDRYQTADVNSIQTSYSVEVTPSLTFNFSGNDTSFINGTNFIEKIFNITLNFTAIYNLTTTPLTIEIYGSNSSNINDLNESVLLFKGNDTIFNGTQITYNWTSPLVEKGDKSLILLMHLDNLSSRNENNGTFFNDSSGNENHGLCVGTNCSVTNTSGKFGGTYTFDGIDNFINVTDITDTDNLSEMTVSAWVYARTLLNLKAVVAKFANSNNVGWVIETGTTGVGGNDDFIVSNYGGSQFGYTNDNEFRAGEWFHVAMVFNGSANINSSRLKFYLNGVNRTLTYQINITNNTLPITNNELRIGGVGPTDSVNRFWNGSIDEVAIWNRSLDDYEILNLYRLRNDTYYWIVNVSVGKTSTLHPVNTIYVNREFQPSIKINTPQNNSNYFENRFNLTISINATSANDSLTSPLTVEIYGSNTTTLNDTLLLFKGNDTIFNGTQITYNWTSLVTDNKDSSLLLLYHLDNRTERNELNGSFFNDSSKLNKYGVCSNCPLFNSSGKFGGTYEFDGVANNITFKTIGLINSSFSLWLNWKDSGDGVVIGGSAGHYAPYIDTTTIYYSAVAGNFVSTAHNGFTSGIWNHVVITRSDRQVRFFKNGVQLGSNLTLGSNAVQDIDTIGGYNVGTFPSTMAIDEVAIWNRSLSANEILDLYRLKNGTYYWKVKISDVLYDSKSVNITPLNTLYVNQQTDAPSIVLNAPANGTTFTQGVFNVILNATPYDDVLTQPLRVEIYGRINSSILNDTTLLYKFNGTIFNGSQVTYNWTSPVTVEDNHTILILHANNETKHNEGTTNFFDASGRRSNLSCSGSSCPFFNISGKFGYALQFDGTNDFINTSSLAANDKQEETISLWVMPHTLTGEHKFVSMGHGLAGSGNFLIIYQTGTSVVFALDTGSYQSITATSALSLNKWTHVVATHSVAASRSELYIDGVQRGTMATYEDTSTNHNFIDIGRDSEDSNYYAGLLDEIAIWNRSLRLSEIEDVYRLKNGTYFWIANVSDWINYNFSETRSFCIGVCAQTAPVISNATINYTDTTFFSTSDFINASAYILEENTEDRINATVVLFVNDKANITSTFDNNKIASSTYSVIFNRTNLTSEDDVKLQFSATDGYSTVFLNSSSFIANAPSSFATTKGALSNQINVSANTTILESSIPARNITLVHGNDSEINTTTLSSNDKLLLSLHFNNESWRNEGNSSFFNDSSGNNHHGSCPSLETRCPRILFDDNYTMSGGIQGFLEFNGSSNITVNSLGLGNNATVIMLIMVNGSSSDGCIICNDNSNPQAAQGATMKNTFAFQAGTNIIVQIVDNNATQNLHTISSSGTNNDPDPKKWRFVAFTSNYSSNSANITLFFQDEISGALDYPALKMVGSTSAINISNLDGDGKMNYYIGQRNTSGAFTGYVDEIAIFNKTLSIPEIQSVYERIRSKYPQNGTYTSKVFDLGSLQKFKNITFNGSIDYPRRLSQKDFPNDKVTIFRFNNDTVGENDTLFLDAANNSLGATCGKGVGNNASRCPSITTGIEGNAVNFNTSQFIRIENQNTSNFDYNNDSSFTIGAIINWNGLGSGGSGINYYIFSMNDLDGIAGSSGSKQLYVLAQARNGGDLSWTLGRNSGFCGGGEAGVTLELKRWYLVALTFNHTTQNKTVWHVSPIPREMHPADSCSSIISGGFNNTNETTIIGSETPLAGARGFNGTIDTIFIVNRTLDEFELLRIYDSAFSEAKLQVRSCDDESCSGETFVGVNGTAGSSFENMTQVYPLNDSIVIPNRFFQWKLSYETYDRLQTADVKLVKVGYGTNAAPVLTNAAINYTNGTFFATGEQINASVTVTDSDSEDRINGTAVLFINDKTNITLQFLNSVPSGGILSIVFNATNITVNNTVLVQWNSSDGLLGSNFVNSTVVTVTSRPSDVLTGSAAEFTAILNFSANTTIQVSATAANVTLVHANDSELNNSLYSNMLLSLHFNNESWRNEGNSSFFNDSSGNNNHGSCSPLSLDPRDKCPKISFEDDLTNSGGIQGFLTFNTTGRNITINPIGLGQNATVILMWMPNATGGLSLCIICHSIGLTKSNTFSVLFSSSTLIMQIRDQNATGTTTTIQVSGAGGSPSDQKWRFMAFTSNYSNNGANVTLFVQDEGLGIDAGALRSVDSPNMINISNLDGDGKMNLYLGSANDSSSSASFNGFIDELAIYNKTLSIPEIRAIFERLRGKYPQNGTFTSKVFDLNTTQFFGNLTFNGSQNYPKRLSQKDFPNDKVTIFRFNNESGENDTLFLSSTNSSLGGTCGNGIGNNASRCPAVTTGIEGKARYFNLTTFMRIEGQNTSNFDFNNDSSATIGIIMRWEWQGSQGLGYIININRDESGALNANRGRKSFGIQGTSNNGAQPFYALGTTAPLCGSAQSGVILERNRWYFLALTFNSSDQNATVWTISQIPRERHRVAACTSIISGGFNNTNGTTLIGSLSTSPQSAFNGTIDTLFILNRTLSELELQNIYDSAFSKARLQIRSCDDINCAGESFVGPANTTTSYFENMTQVYPLNESVVPANRFFQWKLSFETFDRYQSSDVKQVAFGFAETAPNIAPTILNVALGPNPANTTDQFNCSFTVSDPNADDVLTTTIKWYNTTTFYQQNSTVVANGTLTSFNFTNALQEKGESWRCGVQVSDGQFTSDETNSSLVSVVNSRPYTVIQNVPANLTVTTERNVNFSWITSGDADSVDRINYTLEILCIGGCASDNRLLNSTTTSLNLTDDLDFFADDGYFYRWFVRSYDGFEYSFNSTHRTLNISVLVAISTDNSSVNFTNAQIGVTDDTTDNSPRPFIVQNDGNSLINVNKTADKLLFVQAPSPSSAFQFKVDNATGEEGAFNWSGSTTTFTNVAVTTQKMFSQLNFSNLTDSGEADISITPPIDEPPGNRSNILTITGYYAGGFP